MGFFPKVKIARNIVNISVISTDAHTSVNSVRRLDIRYTNVITEIVISPSRDYNFFTIHDGGFMQRCGFVGPAGQVDIIVSADRYRFDNDNDVISTAKRPRSGRISRNIFI